MTYFCCRDIFQEIAQLASLRSSGKVGTAFHSRSRPPVLYACKCHVKYTRCSGTPGFWIMMIKITRNEYIKTKLLMDSCALKDIILKLQTSDRSIFSLIANLHEEPNYNRKEHGLVNRLTPRLRCWDGLTEGIAPCADWIPLLSSHFHSWRHTTHVGFSDSAFLMFPLLSPQQHLPTHLWHIHSVNH